MQENQPPAEEEAGQKQRLLKGRISTQRPQSVQKERGSAGLANVIFQYRTSMEHFPMVQQTQMIGLI